MTRATQEVNARAAYHGATLFGCASKIWNHKYQQSENTCVTRFDNKNAREQHETAHGLTHMPNGKQRLHGQIIKQNANKSN